MTAKMEAKTKNTYRISFKDLKEEFPSIKGDLEEMSVDEKTQEVVVDTITAFFEDEKIVIHKTIEVTSKPVFTVRDKNTGATASGATQQEAQELLNKLLNAQQEKK